MHAHAYCSKECVMTIKNSSVNTFLELLVYGWHNMITVNDRGTPVTSRLRMML
jgi:hypothetical protein